MLFLSTFLADVHLLYFFFLTFWSAASLHKTHILILWLNHRCKYINISLANYSFYYSKGTTINDLVVCKRWWLVEIQTNLNKSWTNVSFSPSSDLAVKMVPLCLSLRNYMSLYCQISGTSPSQCPLSICIPSKSEKFFCSVSFTPPSLPVCIASVRLVYNNVYG